MDPGRRQNDRVHQLDPGPTSSRTHFIPDPRLTRTLSSATCSVSSNRSNLVRKTRTEGTLLSGIPASTSIQVMTLIAGALERATSPRPPGAPLSINENLRVMHSSVHSPRTLRRNANVSSPSSFRMPETASSSGHSRGSPKACARSGGITIRSRVSVHRFTH